MLATSTSTKQSSLRSFSRTCRTHKSVHTRQQNATTMTPIKHQELLLNSSKKNYNFYRATRGIVRTMPSVRPSVHPSVIRRYSVETAMIKVFSPSGSPTILVFHTKRDSNTPTETPYGGVECKG